MVQTMIPYKWPVATSVPKNPEVRREIIKAMQKLAEDDDEPLQRRRAEITSIRRDLAELAQDLAALRSGVPTLILSALSKYGYSPDEPRLPAGNPGGGQWTSEGEVAATPTVVNHGSITPAQQYASTLIIKHPGALTGDPRIDETTNKLVTVLQGVMDTVEYPPGMSPQRQAFGTTVVAEGLPGIGPGDVEMTFPAGSYGSSGSVRTDGVLRDDDGNIIAIYDVKTGAADLTPARADQLRTKTEAPSNTPVIQIRFNEALRKNQLQQGWLLMKSRRRRT
jgi:hypothetical protein